MAVQQMRNELSQLPHSAVTHVMTRSYRWVAVCVALLLPTSSGWAEDKPATAVDRSPPRASSLQEVGVKNLNLLTIWCDLVNQTGQVTTSGTRGRCFFSTTTVRKPSHEETQKSLTGLDAPAVRKELARDLRKCRDWVAPIKPEQVSALPPDRQKLVTMFAEACEKKDTALMIAALKFNIAEIEAKTCKVHGWAAKQFEFNQTSENSWESIDGGPFGGTVVMTIWRDKDGPWNYREARAGDVNCKAGDALCRQPGIVEFRGDNPKTTLECKYVEAGL